MTVEPQSPAPVPAVPSAPHDRGARFVERVDAWIPLIGAALFYLPLLSPDRILVQRDGFRLHYPIRQYFAERVAEGEFPLWYPYDALGRPFVDTAVSAIFHPFSLLYLVFSTPTAYELCCYLSYLLAAVATGALAKRVGLSPAGSACAGLVFALSGYLAAMSDNLLYLYSGAALPLFLLALDAALERGKAWLGVPAAVWASVFLNGDLQNGYWFGFVALAWLAWRGSGSAMRRLLLLAGLGALAAGLSAAQLVPSWFAFASSDRAQGDFLAEATKWSTHPFRLLGLGVHPQTDLLTGEVSAHFFGAGAGGHWARSIYLGAPALVLAGLALATVRRLRVLGYAALLTTVLAFGHHAFLYAVAAKTLPLWSAFRYPEKLLLFTSLALALLAGAGLEQALSRRRAALAFGGAALLAALLGFSAPALAGWRIPSVDPQRLEPFADALRAAGLWSGAILLALGAIALLAQRGTLQARLALAAMLIVVGLDLAVVNRSAYVLGPAEIWEFTPPFVEALRSREGELKPGAFRLVSSRLPRYPVPRALAEELGEVSEVVAVKNALDQENNGVFHIESPGAYLPGASANVSTILMERVTPPILARYDVKYLVTPLSEARSRPELLVADLPTFNLALVRNPVAPAPRVRLASNLETVDDAADWRALVNRPEFLSGALDYIEPGATSLPPQPAAGAVRITSYAPEKVVLEVEAAGPAVVILNDGFDTAWEAVLDGSAPLEILRANGLVRAVVVPEGRHQIEFRYRATRVVAGLTISLATLALSLLLALYFRRRPGGTPPAPAA